MVRMVSVTVPIWFNLISTALAAFSAIPFWTYFVLVTNRSSPTTWIRSPSAAVCALKPAQSFSSRPSSMDTMGYFSTHCLYQAVISSCVFLPCPDFDRLYAPFSKKELAAGSRAMAMSRPGRYPALSMADTMTSQASSLLFRLGANPPSSPTAVAYPFAARIFFRAWNVSAPHRSASAKPGAPTGMAMNSCRSTLLSACLPPLMMFIMGTGNRNAPGPPRYAYSGTRAAAAAALATAMETPRMALAPSLPLLGVPSSSIITWSISACRDGSIPTRAGAMMVFTLPTAFRTPFPPYRFLSPSRSSTASFSPVEAPDGTDADTATPLSSSQRTLTVGFPRESRISNAPIFDILAFILHLSVLSPSSHRTSAKVSWNPAISGFRTVMNPRIASSATRCSTMCSSTRSTAGPGCSNPGPRRRLPTDTKPFPTTQSAAADAYQSTFT